MDPAHAHRERGEAAADHGRLPAAAALQDVPLRHVRAAQGEGQPRHLHGAAAAEPASPHGGAVLLQLHVELGDAAQDDGVGHLRHAVGVQADERPQRPVEPHAAEQGLRAVRHLPAEPVRAPGRVQQHPDGQLPVPQQGPPAGADLPQPEQGCLVPLQPAVVWIQGSLPGR